MFLIIIVLFNCIFTKILKFSSTIHEKLKMKQSINKKYLLYNNISISSKPKIRLLSDNSIKCKIRDEFSLKNSLCIECNKEKGYYPVNYNYENDINFKKYINYSDCYNKDTVPSNFYFNSESNMYEECFESCKSCYGHGDQKDNNCSSCKENYIFKPGIKNTKNCVMNCKYYFYFSLVGKYLCTYNYHCPEKLNLITEDKNQCIYDCNIDDVYKYQYNGECLKECPENTQPNYLNQCLDINTEKCTLTIKSIKMEVLSINSSIIDEMVQTYANEFNYTYNHITQFVTNNFSILFFKNKSCLFDFNLNSSIIDYDECLSKIIKNYDIFYPIVTIVDIIGKVNNPSTKYAFFNPISGQKLNTSFCQNTFIIVKKNISSLYIKDKYEWLAIQNIDFYNINNPFYINICFHYESYNKKDIILTDRILEFFPNTTLCENDCEYKGTNCSSLISRCDCKYDDMNYNLINANILEDDMIKKHRDELVDNMVKKIKKLIYNKIHVWSCYKNIIIFKYFISSIGGDFVIVLFLIQIICDILLIHNDYLNKIKKFILLMTNLYVNYRKNKNKNKNKTNNYHQNNKIDSKIKNKSKIENEKVKEKTKNNLKTTPESTKEIKNKKEKNNNFDRIKTKEIKENINLSSLMDITKRTLENINKESKNIGNKKESKYRKYSIITLNSTHYLKKFDNNEGNFTEKDMKEFLSTSPDEMGFHNAVIKDKRSFYVFLGNKIVKKQIIVNTFFIKNEGVPIYLKLILFTLYIELYFLGNAMIYSQEEIRMLYYVNRKEYIHFSIERFITKIFICFTITNIIHFVLELFLTNPQAIKTILKREKNNEKILREEINKLIKSLQIRYILFIVINLILKLLSWFMIFCFNDGYPYTQFDWLLQSVIMLVISQIISAAIAFVETCLRFFAIKYKIEGIFDLSKYLNKFY